MPGWYLTNNLADTFAQSFPSLFEPHFHISKGHKYIFSFDNLLVKKIKRWYRTLNFSNPKLIMSNVYEILHSIVSKLNKKKQMNGCKILIIKIKFGSRESILFNLC